VGDFGLTLVHSTVSDFAAGSGGQRRLERGQFEKIPSIWHEIDLT
jgi:hypothetical protein